MGKRTFEDVKKYVEWQGQGKCNVLSAKPEQHFDDLGVDVCVWNVKTDTDGDWWVVEGNSVPINLYPQGAYYFGADEVYSFHMGLMQRMGAAQNEYNPEDFVNGVTLETEIAPQLFRKLKNIATLIDTAKEIEDFQAIGVQCREILIELGNYIYEPMMAGDNEQPQVSNFKRKAELFTRFYLKGAENSDYRSITKKLTEQRGITQIKSHIPEVQPTTKRQLVLHYVPLLLESLKTFFRRYLTRFHSIIAQYVKVKNSVLMVKTQTKMEWFKNSTYAARNVVP